MIFTKEQIAASVDLACLKPDQGELAVRQVCNQAASYGCASVCVKPSYVISAVRELGGTDVGVGTVIGFPNGGANGSIKAEEASYAVSQGAAEVDVVLNIGKLKDLNYDYTAREVEAIVDAVEDETTIKLILETCYLSLSQIAKVCRIAIDYDIDFVKTSTGFGSDGATPQVVRTMLKCAGDTGLEVKASGGIKTFADAQLYLSMGCTRLGSSRIKELLA